MVKGLGGWASRRSAARPTARRSRLGNEVCFWVNLESDY